MIIEMITYEKHNGIHLKETMRHNKINKNKIDTARIFIVCFCVWDSIPIIHISGNETKINTINLMLQASIALS